MRRKIFSVLLFAILSLFSFSTFSQGVVKGVVVDDETNELLTGSSVVVDGTKFYYHKIKFHLMN